MINREEGCGRSKEEQKGHSGRANEKANMCAIKGGKAGGDVAVKACLARRHLPPPGGYVSSLVLASVSSLVV